MSQNLTKASARIFAIVVLTLFSFSRDNLDIRSEIFTSIPNIEMLCLDRLLTRYERCLEDSWAICMPHCCVSFLMRWLRVSRKLQWNRLGSGADSVQEMTSAVSKGLRQLNWIWMKLWPVRRKGTFLDSTCPFTRNWVASDAVMRPRRFETHLKMSRI